jgi:membrane dipeptidase
LNQPSSRWIFDGHLDLAWNAIDWKRDLTRPVAELRLSERGRTEPGYGTNTVSLPALKEGRVRVAVATILARLHRPGNPMFGYATPEAVYAVGRGQLAYYDAMQAAGQLVILRSRADLDRHIERSQQSLDAPLGIILSMEGADPVLDPNNIREWHALGLRAIGLTHYGKNRYGGGTACSDGLEPPAWDLLRIVEDLGIALDLTHLSDEAFWQATTVFHGRVLASHQNARRFVGHQRQFSDDQLRLVIERGGVIGAAFDAWMLQPDFHRGQTRPDVTMERIVDNIEHVCQLAGNARHAALGTDLDGGFGIEQTPTDIDTIADVIRVADILARRGFSEPDIAGILHANWTRFFQEVLPSS